MKKYLLPAILFATYCSFQLPAYAGKAEKGSAPKFTIAQAEKVALENFKGKIVSKKLDFEWGKPLYEFNIKTPANNLIEVEIDGHTGEILEVEKADDDD